MAVPADRQSRQELCEALPYYRAFQSGMYMSKRVPFGYLLDGFPSPYVAAASFLLCSWTVAYRSRDAWASEGRVIISHG